MDLEGGRAEAEEVVQMVREGEAVLASYRLELFRPLQPMLADSADAYGEANTSAAEQIDRRNHERALDAPGHLGGHRCRD